MPPIDTLGDERILVADHGHESVRISITDPMFGRIATVRLDHFQAAELADALGRDGVRDEDVA